jgi:hypothetical protein
MYAGQVEFLNRLQKEFAAEKNYEAAKMLKEPIKHFVQAEKCSTLVVNYFERETHLYRIDWPTELVAFLDYEFNCIYQGEKNDR